MEYKGYKVHVMNFGSIFQYWFANRNGELYQDYITFPARFINQIKFHLKLIDSKYTKEELQIAEDIMLSGAVASIDALVKEEQATKKHLDETSKIVNKLKKNPDCIWRARSNQNSEKIYQCIIHDESVPFVDNEIPFHEITSETKILSPIQMERIDE